MKLIVGLGNPGLKYQGTRHNVGFDVIGCLGRRLTVGRAKAKFNAEFVEARIGNEKCVLLTPLTFMNLSGQSVRAAVEFYKVEIENCIVVCDDLALPLGKIRLRAGGSAGGQKGLADIIQRLGRTDLPRLRVGVGQPPAGRDAADYVLGQFSSQEKIEIEVAIQKAAEAIETWVVAGLQTAMNRFNVSPEPSSRSARPDQSTADKLSKNQLDSTINPEP